MLHHESLGDAFDLHFEPSHQAASQTRQRARDLLDENGVPAEVAGDVELVIAELVSNAVHEQPDHPIELQLAITATSVYLSVANRTSRAVGQSLPPRAEASTANEQLVERGRGLSIVQALTDELWFDSEHGWTTVSCLRRYGRPTEHS